MGRNERKRHWVEVTLPTGEVVVHEDCEWAHKTRAGALQVCKGPVRVRATYQSGEWAKFVVHALTLPKTADQ